MSGEEKRTVGKTVQLSESEMQAIREAASACGMNTSAYIRHQATEAAKKEQAK